jgi:beta-lactamase regulating signal transducer with metallopeptidase domain
MATWMLFALAPGLALCCAALLAEQAVRQRRWPSRVIWLVAMAGSILLPTLGPAIPQLAPFHLPLTAPVGALDAQEVAPAVAHGVASAHPQAAAWARALWIALSLATATSLAACALLVRHRARHWRRVIIDGRETLIAPKSGPAVFGWWRPRIVLPSWLASAPSRQRQLALAHEQSHLDAHDPQLLGVALALLAIMPWNLSLWWQLRRMRHAIEVDCDTRVLRQGHDVLDYGEALLALGLRRSQHYGLMSASDSSNSLLERRIRIMSSQPNHWSRLTAGTLLGLSLCAVALAAELAPARAATTAASPPVAAPADLVAPPAPLSPPAKRSSRDLPAALAPPAPPAPHASPALPALPAPPAPPPRLPALAAIAPMPPLPPVAAAGSRASVDSEDESEDEGSASDAVDEAKAEAEEAAERATELKGDAEEAEKAAQEAKRDAEEQQAQAEDAKREAEAAAREANARKQAAEAAAAAHAAQTSSRVN